MALVSKILTPAMNNSTHIYVTKDVYIVNTGLQKTGYSGSILHQFFFL